MTWTAWDLSRGACLCSDRADELGWEASSSNWQTAFFRKGERWMMLYLARHGGIVHVDTDEGPYTGPDRAGWAVRYITSHSKPPYDMEFNR